MEKLEMELKKALFTSNCVVIIFPNKQQTKPLALLREPIFSPFLVCMIVPKLLYEYLPFHES